VSLRWRRLQCTHCGRTIIPLRAFLGLDRWASHTGELEQVVTEVVSQQSYRRGAAHLRTIGEIPAPKSTAHRWVAASPCDQFEASPEPFDYLLADGTGYKARVGAGEKAGELRLAVGITAAGQTVRWAIGPAAVGRRSAPIFARGWGPGGEVAGQRRRGRTGRGTGRAGRRPVALPLASGP